MKGMLKHFFHNSSQFFRFGAAEERTGFYAAIHGTLFSFHLASLTGNRYGLKDVLLTVCARSVKDCVICSLVPSVILMFKLTMDRQDTQVPL